MRVILLNDTSNNDHYGCFAVSNGLRAYFERRDDVVVVPIFNRQLQVDGQSGEIVAEQRVWLDAQIAAADYVVVNGEGTLHAGRAPEIELALAAARRLGKPFCVANSILRDYAILGEALGDADFVTLRDDRSVAEAGGLGVRATRCADAALFARFEDWSAGASPRGVAATDWHRAALPWVRERVLAAVADGACFLPFRHPAAWSDWPGIVARLAGFRHVVCGRYHGALLAILAGCEVTLLRSNTDKIEELARELGLQAFLAASDGSPPATDAGRALAEAAERLAAMRADPAAHPLYPLGLGAKPYAVGRTWNRPEGVFVGRQAMPVERARALVDAMRPLRPPLPRAERMSLSADLSAEPCEVLEICEAMLRQEARLDLVPTIVGAFRAQGAFARAFAAALRLVQEGPTVGAHQKLFADAALAAGDAEVALGFFELAGRAAPLAGQPALRAARAAGRNGDYARQFELLRLGLGASPPSGVLREIAVAASRLGRHGEAVEHARRACAAEPPLSGWPRMHLGIVLAANGAFVEGHAVMAAALADLDPGYRALREAAAPDAGEAALYVPDRIGVGSAMLAAAVLREAGAGGIELVLVDPRLHVVFARAFPGLRCLPASAEAPDVIRRRRLLSIFDAFALADPQLLADGGRPFFAADPDRLDSIAARYRREHGDRPRVGIAWSTVNPRTGRDRNLTLPAVRGLVLAHPDTLFLSLQAGVRGAERDRRIVGAGNLVVDAGIDPIASPEDQLAQIAALDEVVAIDCSAAHFSGALGRPTGVLLTGEPTWHWPQGRSFYSSARVVRSAGELAIGHGQPGAVETIAPG